MAESASELRFLKMRYNIDEHLKVGFMMLKEIKSGTIFGTAVIQVEKSNDGQGSSGKSTEPSRGF